MRTFKQFMEQQRPSAADMKTMKLNYQYKMVTNPDTYIKKDPVLDAKKAVMKLKGV